MTTPETAVIVTAKPLEWEMSKQGRVSLYEDRHFGFNVVEFPSGNARFWAGRDSVGLGNFETLIEAQEYCQLEANEWIRNRVLIGLRAPVQGER